jgi:hypothetical protein
VLVPAWRVASSRLRPSSDFVEVGERAGDCLLIVRQLVGAHAVIVGAFGELDVQAWGNLSDVSPSAAGSL